jgi:hypothetical protein
MPVWVSVGDQPVRSREDAEYFIDRIDQTLRQALESGPWNNDWEKQQIEKLYSEARAKMVQRRDEAR